MPLLLAEVQEMKGRVVKEIRANKELEEGLNLMDIKIGLLVQNRLGLDVSCLLFLLPQSSQVAFLLSNVVLKTSS